MTASRRTVFRWGAGLALLNALTARAESRSWDLTVIGSGLAGLSAAIAGAEAGRRVLLLEKGMLLGGHSLYSSGSIAAVAPHRTRAAGIQDSVDLFVEDAWRVGEACGNRPVLETIAEHSHEALNLLERTGIRLGGVFQASSGLRPRAYAIPGEASGRNYILALAKHARELGVTIRLNTEVVELRRSVGRGFELNCRQSGEAVEFMSEAVVIATGGFTANVPARMKIDGRLSADIHTSANPYGLLWDGADGDGIRLAQALGGAVTEGFGLQLLPIGGGRVLDYAGADLYVNDEGRRFVNEAAPRRELASAILALPDKRFWVITDQQSRKNATLGPKLLNGIVKKSPDIRSMAREMGIRPDVLERTIADYNRAADAKFDPEFGKSVFTQRISEPPFYWGRERIYVHTTLDGIRTDHQARVLDRSGRPIDGLFAAGETVGGVFGKDRLGGMGLTNCIVMGRMAGGCGRWRKV